MTLIKNCAPSGVGRKYESHHGVKYTPQAIQASVYLSQRYIADRFLPDKVRRGRSYPEGGRRGPQGTKLGEGCTRKMWR